jgi:hypothetical protein
MRKILHFLNPLRWYRNRVIDECASVLEDNLETPFIFALPYRHNVRVMLAQIQLLKNGKEDNLTKALDKVGKEERGQMLQALYSMIENGKIAIPQNDMVDAFLFTWRRKV